MFEGGGAEIGVSGDSVSLPTSSCPFLAFVYNDKRLLSAHELVLEMFEGKIRRTGHPAHTHSFEVSEILFDVSHEFIDTELTITLVLLGKMHDLLEDTAVTEDFISKNFGSVILKPLLLLTKNYKSEDQNLNENNFDNYLKGLDNAPDFVKLVKMADKLHNLSTLIDTKDDAFIERQIKENLVYLPRFYCWVISMDGELQEAGIILLEKIYEIANVVELIFNRSKCPLQFDSDTP